MERERFLNFFLISLFILAIINLIFLDWQLVKLKNEFTRELGDKVSSRELQNRLEFLSSSRQAPSSDFGPAESQPPPAAPKSPTGQEANFCPLACLTEVKRLEQLIAQITPTVIRETQTKLQPVSSQSVVKEVSISLGSGSTTSRDWADVPGLNSYINTANYPKIKSVVFEVSLRIPQAVGRAEARAWNKTGGHLVWNSEVFSESPESILKAAAITLSPGDNLYQVQARSTLGAQVFVDSSRIKIVLE